MNINVLRIEAKSIFFEEIRKLEDTRRSDTEVKMFMAMEEGCKYRIFQKATREIKDATTSIGCNSLKILKILWMFREIVTCLQKIVNGYRGLA